MNRRLIINIVIIVLVSVGSTGIKAADSQWQTYFAYNNVTNIAVSPMETYALANGLMFSVNKTTEQLTKYDRRFGLHGSEMAYLAYDESRKQLIIMYADGKVDIMKNGRIHYVPDLYNKRMTVSKYCNNVTIKDSLAYLSMEFGILTFNLNTYQFPDAYYIAPEAEEVRVLDVMIYGDSIYAKTADGNYCARLKDNIVDFRFWKQCKTPPVPFDANKGKRYTDEHGDVWASAGAKGVYRHPKSGEELYYLPDGPQVNTPYSMTMDGGRLFVVPGGRWASQYSRPGHVMILENNGKWTNITQAAIRAQTGKPVLDFMNVAVDPKDGEHFFVTSYGTGLYEFRGEQVVTHYTPANSILGSAAPNYPDQYTRTDGAFFDSEGNLWVTVDGGVDATLVAFKSEKSQQGLNLYPEGSRLYLNTSGGVIEDNHHPHRKWILSCRANPAIILLDDNGTTFDSGDDRVVARLEVYDQDNQAIVPELLYAIAQAPNGDIWVGSDKGPIIIDAEQDFLSSNQCRRLRIEMPDGTNLLETERVNAFAFDKEKEIWIGTQTTGVYVLNEDATKIVAHYTMDNSAMPSNAILSLAYDDLNNTMFIGTGSGLVSYKIAPDTSTNIIDTSEDNWTYGNMKQWRAHFAYLGIDEMVEMGDKVYALSCNSLFSVDKQTEEIEYYNHLTGLNGSKIEHICYNPTLERMLIAYQDGQLDVVNRRGDVQNISDLYLKQTSASMQVNDICMYNQYAYLAMDFGIVVVDMQKLEVKDTYYIGQDAKEVNVSYLTIMGNDIYAIADNLLYVADIQDNIIDYSLWKHYALPSTQQVQGMRANAGRLYVVMGGALWTMQNGQWQRKAISYTLKGLCASSDRLFAIISTEGLVEIKEDMTATMVIHNYRVSAIAADGGYWLGTQENGVVRVKDGNYQEFYPDGPISNSSYRLRCFGDRLYVLAGGRWASQNNNPGIIMYYENGHWTNVNNKSLVAGAKHIIYDVMNVAQDPNNANHYYITTYGTGMLEMNGDEVVKLHLPSNSGLQAVLPNSPDYYTRTDGAMFDEQGNLWVLNAGLSEKSISVMTPDSKWFTLNTGNIPLHTPGEILQDARNPQWKWIPLCRSNTGLILLQDNGTPTNPADDKVIYRNEWVDQQEKQVLSGFIYTIAQDKDNALWVGTSAGLFIIPASVDFAASNRCERVIIPRNDGTDLGDYLLANEQINCIVVDGVNRKWIGTATSGVFLMSADGKETIAHFTSTNSLLPDDNVLSIAIMESTGEVFIGTSSGLVSYMSDAIEPEENYDSLYAYPNPVHPNYHGYITIKGLMDNSEVRITDSNGNLVKLLQGNGGEAVWDGTNTIGKRVASGVYTAVCNTSDGSGHGTTKILIMN